jgi:hypothetical protein
MSPPRMVENVQTFIDLALATDSSGLAGRSPTMACEPPSEARANEATPVPAMRTDRLVADPKGGSKSFWNPRRRSGGAMVIKVGSNLTPQRKLCAVPVKIFWKKQPFCSRLHYGIGTERDIGVALAGRSYESCPGIKRIAPLEFRYITRVFTPAAPWSTDVH